MEIWQAFGIVGGVITGITTFLLLIIKVIAPALKARDKLQKIDNIDKNYIDIKKHDDRITILEEHQENYIDEIKSIKGNIEELGDVTSMIARGVKCLLGKELGKINDDPQLEKVYEDFQKREKVVSFCLK